MLQRGVQPLFLLLLLGLVACSTPNRAPVYSLTSESSYNKKKPAPSKNKFYRVRKGDTLYAIAWREGLDYKRLAKWNNLARSYTIYPGQLLRLKPYKKKVIKTKKKPPKVLKKPKKQPTKIAKSKKKPTAQKKVVKKTTTQHKLKWRWPANGKLLSKYSSRNETNKGIDISGSLGARVRAAEAGKVVYSGSGLIGYGKLVIVKHNSQYLSAYGHNSQLLVKEGQVIKKGDVIAKMGRSNSGQAMLHFEIRKQGKPVNPIALLPRK